MSNITFSAYAKNELSKINNYKNKKELYVELLGYMSTSNFSIDKKLSKYSTENEYNINRFAKLLNNNNINDYKIAIQGNTYIITIKNLNITDIKTEEYIENINEENLKKAFIRGVFLGSGYINNPEKEYHLEVILKEEKIVSTILSFLGEFNIKANKLYKDKYISLYIKDSDEISKFLAFVGANSTVIKFEEIRVIREMKNNINRLVNCETANLNKTIGASVEQISIIKKLRKAGKFDSLPEDLKEIASYDLGWGSYEMDEVLSTSISALCDKSETGVVDDLACGYYSDNYNYHYYDYYDFYQITSEGESIIIYNRGDDLVLDKNLTSMYRRANSWKGKYGDSYDYSYNFISPNEYLIAGSLRDSEGYSSFIKVIKDNQESFYYTDSHYLTFLFPIKVNDKYIVLGLSEREETDIIVISESGRVIQKFSGNYWNLRSLDRGFAVTNLGTSIYNYIANTSGSRKVYTEVYYDYNVRIESDGNGDIILDRKIVEDKEYMVIKTDSNKGYVLDDLKVIDNDGNEIEVEDNAFLVPASDTRVLASFKKVNNPLTGDNVMIIVLILIVSGGLLILLRRQRRQKLEM